MAPSALREHWGLRGVQPGVGFCIEHLDAVAVDLIVGVEGPKAIGSAAKDIHLCANDGSRVEVSPASWRTLGGAGQKGAG